MNKYLISITSILSFFFLPHPQGEVPSSHIPFLFQGLSLLNLDPIYGRKHNIFIYECSLCFLRSYLFLTILLQVVWLKVTPKVLKSWVDFLARKHCNKQQVYKTWSEQQELCDLILRWLSSKWQILNIGEKKEHYA